MQHVDDGRLHAWLDDGLSEADAAAVAAHLEACAACRVRLDEERALRDRAAALLAIDEPAIDHPPFDVLAARARGGAGSVEAADRVDADQGGRRVWRRWLPPVGWAASVLFALAIGWMARDFIQPADAPSEVMASAARSEVTAIDRVEPSEAARREAQAEVAGPASTSPAPGAEADSRAPTEDRQAAEGRFERAAGASLERTREAPAPPQVSAAAPPSLPEPATVAPPPVAAAPPPPSPASVSDAAAVEQESRSAESARPPASAVEPPRFGGRGGRGGGGGGGGGGGRGTGGRAAPEPAPAPAPPRAQQVVEPAREPFAGPGQLELGLSLGQQGQALGFLGTGWQVVGRTEAAARAGMALYGIPGMEPAQTAIGPGDRQVRTRYLLESGSILDLIQERESSLAFAPRDEIVAQPSTAGAAASNPRVWIARRDDVRVTLQTDATDVNLEALAGRLMID